MSEKLLSTLFRPQTLLILQQADGTPTVPCGYAAGSRPQVTLQGYITHCTADTITLACTDGTTRQLTAAELANASYLYIGFPTMQAEVEVPQPLKGNATIEKIMGTIATLRLPDGQRKNVTWNFTDKELKLKASANPVGLTGLEVLFVTRESGNIPKSHLLAATTLDQALNDIAQITAEGKRELALDFSRLLLQQFPDDSDILNYIARLTAPDEAAADERTDFYAPFPKPDENMLAPMGRIYEVNYRGGYIIDVNSHEKLFFFKEQLLDRLEKMSDKQLVGQPVVYSITRSKDKKSFQARSILMPMDIEDTYRVAEDMHYNDWGLRVTAYDILRIIDQQFNEEGIKDDLLGWRDNKVRNELWDYVTPPPYSGPTTQLYLPAPAQTSGPAVLLTHGPHTVMAPSEDYLPPEAPSIFFGPLPVGKEQSEREPSAAEETGKGHHATELPQTDTEELPMQPQPGGLKQTKEPTPSPSWESQEGAENTIPVTDEEIDRDLDHNKLIKPNATISFRFGTGILHAIDGDGRDYQFYIDDIIDEELRSDVKSRSMSTNYVKDKEVVTQLNPFGGRATNICSPHTVGEMLHLARQAYQEALWLHEQEEYAPVEDTNSDLQGYRLAKSFAEVALSAVPTNPLAIRLLNAIEKSISDDVGNYYRAPQQALPMLGEVWCMKTNGDITIKDNRFAQYPLLAKAYIAERDYDTIRKCDQLIYALYWNTHKNKRIARFAVLARTAEELLNQAKEWLKEKEYVKAWGIARQVMEASQENKEAAQIVSECEAAVNADGQPVVSEQLRSGWNQPVNDNPFAKAKQQNQIGKIDKHKAVHYLQNYIEELEDQHNGSNNHEIHGCVNFCLILYHELFVSTPSDETLRNEYKKFGLRHGLMENKTEHYNILKSTTSGLETFDYIIQYHIDMGNDDHLVNAYKEQIRLLSEDKKMASDEITGKIATANANIAWIYVRTKRNDVAQQYKELALGSDPTNSLALLCNAVLEGRKQKTNNISGFKRQNIQSLDDYLKNCATETGQFCKGRNIDAERFNVLCTIMRTKEKGELQRLLARYLSTLINNEAGYDIALQEGKNLPSDCWFVQQLNECVRQQSASWAGWMDVRLVTMLSTAAADCICETLFNLDRTAAHDILTASGVEVLYPGHQMKDNYFKQCFEEWRGSNYKLRFVGVLNQTDRLNTDTDLNTCADFFRNLHHEQWMQSADSEVIARIRQQLPDLLISFASAANARQLINLHKRIMKETTELKEQMEHRPTVLSLTAFYQLIVHIQEKVGAMFDKRQFSNPSPKVSLLQASAISADGMMTIEVEVNNATPFAYAMTNCQLAVVNPADELKTIAPPLTYDDAAYVYGGEKLAYILQVKVAASLRTAKHGDLLIELSFGSSSDPKGNRLKTAPYTVGFDITDSYGSLPNNFDPGDPARVLYGRDEYLKEVIQIIDNPTDTPHFFIYGQKRCGKTSVLEHIRKHLKNSERLVCININYLEFSVLREDDIYEQMLVYIVKDLKKASRKAATPLPQELLVRPEKDSAVYYHKFKEYLENVKEAFAETPGWQQRKLVLTIDEFTSAYKWMKKGLITEQFMQRWKSLRSDNLFCAVLVGQDVLHSFLRDAGMANYMAIFKWKRLTYLQPHDARRLITETMLEATGGHDIFLDKAVDQILFYSASSAFYTKWICYKLTEYLNTHKLSKVSKADVEAAVREAINSDPNEVNTIFDPLLYSGVDPIESEYTKEQTSEILNQVAEAELDDPQTGCHKSRINSSDKNVVVKNLLDNLDSRDVLVKNGDYYSLNVKLYLRWTQKNKFGNV